MLLMPMVLQMMMNRSVLPFHILRTVTLRNGLGPSSVSQLQYTCHRYRPDRQRRRTEPIFHEDGLANSSRAALSPLISS